MADDICEDWENRLILHLIENGAEHDWSVGVATTFFDQQREDYAGDRVTIKRGYSKYPPSVIRKVRSAFNGRNGAEVRRKFGLSRTHFYRVINK